MLLNNDTIVTPGFLEPLINIFKNFKDTGAVQPKILFNHDRTLIWSAGGRYFPWIAQSPTIGYLKKDQDRYNKPKQTDWTSNCCALYSTEALLKAGLLNEIYFYGSFDDVDVSLKISALGKKLFYCPESVIYHIAGMAARSETPEAEGQMKPFVRYLVSRNNWFFIRTHTPWFFLPLVFIYTSMHATALLCFSLIKGRKSKAKAILGGYIDGLRLPLEPEKINHSEAIQYYSR